jgi:RimJ/RimL family protein N-acetyltransferase
LSKLIARLRRRLGLHLCVFLTRPFGDAPVPPARHETLRYGVMAEAQLLAACADADLDLNESQVRAALRRGDVCVGVFDGDRVIGYVWYAFQPAPYAAGILVEFDARTRYLYKTWLRPSHRGRGIAPELYVRAEALCPREGRGAGVTIAHVDNTASIRAMERAGWRRVGYAGCLARFGRVLSFSSFGAWTYGFRFRRAQPAGKAAVTFAKRTGGETP